MKNILITVLLLLVTGCAGVSTPPTEEVSPVAGVEPIQTMPDHVVTPDNSPQQADAGSVIVEPEPKPVMSGNRAVIALLDRAELDSKSGRRDAAGASLERALRIEPRNPWLWQQLSEQRLLQGQYAQAVTLAKKSNSFSAGQHKLQAGNWLIIGKARVALGDTAGADQAFRQAAELVKK